MKSFKILALLVILLESGYSNSQDFEVAPTKLNYDCEGGQTQTKIVSVKNHSNQKGKFILTVSDLVLDSLGNKKKVASNTKVENSCKDWITISPAFFDLNPNESAEVKVVMQVPSGHSETRWAIIQVNATDEQTSMEADKAMRTGIKVKPRIGIRVVQSPKSNKNYKGSIGDLTETTGAKDTVRTFTAKVSNTGDKVLEAKVYLILSDLETAKEIKAKPDRITVMPGNKRIVKLMLPAGVPPGKYSLAVILDYGNNSTLEAAQMNIEVK